MAARLKRGVVAAVACALWAAAALATVQPAAARTAGKQAWTEARVSPGLHSLNQAATVQHEPRAGTVPRGAVITQVLAQRDYAGSADVQTSLCWGTSGRCVDITGRALNTRAFEGLDASQPMRLVHRVTAWRGSHPPLYVKGNVTVWYALPEAVR